MIKRALVCVGIALAALVSAQQFRDIRTTVSGSGELRINDAVSKVSEASVTLDQLGTFSLSLKAERRNFNLTGTWTRTSPIAARLTIKGGSFRDARGTADVVLNSDWSLSSISLNGASVEGSFIGTFKTAKGGGSSGTPIGGALDQTRSGTGSVRFTDDRGRERITRARVVLTRRGDFEITVTGRTTWRYVGTWRHASDSEVRLNLADATGQSGLSGTGVIHSDFRGGFSSFELSGKANGKTFSVDFRADRDSGDGWELSDTVRGQGLINGPKEEDYTLKKATVNLYGDGTFEIVLESDRSHTYYGRWRDAGNQIDLVLTNVAGAGNLVRYGRSVQRFAFAYTEAGKNYVVSFEASR